MLAYLGLHQAMTKTYTQLVLIVRTPHISARKPKPLELRVKLSLARQTTSISVKNEVMFKQVKVMTRKRNIAVFAVMSPIFLHSYPGSPINTRPLRGAPLQANQPCLALQSILPLYPPKLHDLMARSVLFRLKLLLLHRQNMLRLSSKTTVQMFQKLCQEVLQPVLPNALVVSKTLLPMLKPRCWIISVVLPMTRK